MLLVNESAKLFLLENVDGGRPGRASGSGKAYAWPRVGASALYTSDLGFSRMGGATRPAAKPALLVFLLPKFEDIDPPMVEYRPAE